MYYCAECNAWHLTSKEYIPDEEYNKSFKIVHKKRWKKLLKRKKEIQT